MHIVIIGNGISGITAARHIRKRSPHEVTVISSETEYFFSRTALMYVFMGHMRLEDTKPYEDIFWQKNNIRLLKAQIETIDFDEKKLMVAGQSDGVGYDKLIIATGSKSNKFGWKGQHLDGAHGLYHLADLEAMERHTQRGLQRAVIVGGGLIGCEMAEMFHARHVAVTFLVRENSFWNAILPAEESEMVNRHLREHGIDLRLDTELAEILDDGTGSVGGATTNKGETIYCGFVGLTAGVSPSIDFLKNTPLQTERGVLVDEFLQTNLPDVYAIGDCAELRVPQPSRRPIEAIWYTGRMMGETVAHTVCGSPTAYVPQLWFNSAKFFDIEYQVYGDVSTELPAAHSTIYWEHRSAKKSIRIEYNTDSQVVVGFLLMGIRYRHEVCEKWILEKTPIETVLQHLSLANFDSEFFAQHEKEVIGIYNRQSGKNIRPKGRRKLNFVTRFLRGISLK